jgi:uncharacterized protein
MTATLDGIAAPAPPGGPPPPGERVGVLDVLRGLALIGMYVVHFNYYEATPAGATPGPSAAFLEQALWLLFSERFYAIFGMLFGVGFAIQLARADGRGEPFVGRYLRRLAGLAVFGFIAEGVFGYNVLFGYAMWGLPLLLVRRWPVRALVVLAIACAASRPIYTLVRIGWYDRQPDGMAQFDAENAARTQRFQAARAAHDAGEQASDWGTVIAARMRFMPAFHRQWSFLPSGSFTLFLVGMIWFRLGLFNRPEANRRLIVALMIGGVASWVAATWILPIGPSPQGPPQGLWKAFGTMARTTGFSILREQWLAFTYIGVVLLLVARDRVVWLKRLSPLAWAGRMALTNYMIQVILVDVLFTPHGFDLRIPALLVPVGAVALFAAQVTLSRWWLSRYRFGPLEWIWRCVTYWRREPLRLAPTAQVPVAASAT